MMENVFHEKQIVKNIINEIEGFLSESEGQFLYNMAKNCQGKEGVIVEIGSWKGKSTICLGSGSKAASKVRIYAIDPHRDTSAHKVFGAPLTFEEFKKNIQAAVVNDIIFPIVETSKDAAEIFNYPIEFLFIDGEHEYEMVKLDFELWYPKVIDGGFIAFHDYWFSGPKKVIEKYILLGSRHFKDIRIVDSIFFVQKVRKNSIKDRIINIFLFFIYKCRDLYYTLPFRKPRINLITKISKTLKIIK